MGGRRILGVKRQEPSIDRHGLLKTTIGEQPPCLSASESPFLELFVRHVGWGKWDEASATVSGTVVSPDDRQKIFGRNLQRRSRWHRLQRGFDFSIGARIIQDIETRPGHP